MTWRPRRGPGQGEAEVVRPRVPGDLGASARFRQDRTSLGAGCWSSASRVFHAWSSNTPSAGCAIRSPRKHGTDVKLMTGRAGRADTGAQHVVSVHQAQVHASKVSREQMKDR